MYVCSGKITQSMVILQENTQLTDKWLAGRHTEAMLQDRNGAADNSVSVTMISSSCTENTCVRQQSVHDEAVQDKCGDAVHAVTSSTVKLRRAVGRV